MANRAHLSDFEIVEKCKNADNELVRELCVRL